MKLSRDETHSPHCTAVDAYLSGRLRSPWSASFRIEEDSDATRGRHRWYVVPCADPRCEAVRRLSFDRPAHPPARRPHAA